MQTKFIAIEGPDGAGKTGLTNRVGEWLNKEIKAPTVVTHNPGSTDFAEAMRGLAFSSMTSSKQAKALAFLTAEADTFDRMIIPALVNGQHSLADRWVMSGRIYQSFLSNRPPEPIERMIKAALPHPMARPDVYIVLNADPDVLLHRVIDSVQADRAERLKKVKGKDAAKKKEKMVQEGEAEREALEGRIDYYRQLWAAYSRPMVFSDGVPCVTLDTTEKSEDEIFDRVREIVMLGVLSK